MVASLNLAEQTQWSAWLDEHHTTTAEGCWFVTAHAAAGLPLEPRTLAWLASGHALGTDFTLVRICEQENCINPLHQVVRHRPRSGPRTIVAPRQGIFLGASHQFSVWQVLTIICLYLSGEYNTTTLAHLYGVTPEAIRLILIGRSYNTPPSA